ncbi:MAG: sugar nucleotide-binding protein, partial [Bauldia sp.]
ADAGRRPLRDHAAMRVLIAGAAGMLGTDVVGAAGRRGHDVFGLTRHELDITDPASIDAAIVDVGPDAIIDCAAWSDVDGGALVVLGASLLYPSTDYVFDGSKDGPYLEGDMPAPINAYGRTKLGGEVSVAAANPRHFIVRTSWLFGLGGGNFVETMLRIGAEQPEVLVVSDQRGCPTSTADLAEGLVELIATDAYGIHHMVGGGACSWFDFAVEIFDQAGTETRVMSATTEMMARKAARPAYSVLGHGRDDAIELPDWRRSLRRYLDDRELVR